MGWFRDLLWLSGGEVIAKILGFLAFAYLARTLPLAGYGGVELAVALAVPFALIVDAGLGPIGAREVARRPERAPELAAGVPALRLLLAAVCVPLMGAAGLALRQGPAVERLVFWYALALLPLALAQTWLFQGLGRMGEVAAGQLIRRAGFLLGVVLLVHEGAAPARVGVSELGAAALAALFYLGAQVRQLGWVFPPLRATALGRLLVEAIPVGLGQVVWAVNQYLPTLLVGLLVGGESLAWYGAANRIVVSLGAFSFLYHFNLYPDLVTSLGKSREAFRALVRPSFRVSGWAGAGVALAGSMAAAPLCRLAFGASYAAAAPPLAILLWSLPLHLLSGHARWALISVGRQRSVLTAQLAGTVTVVSVGALAVPRFGAQGAAAALVLATLVVWTAAHLAARRQLGPLPLWCALRPLGAAGVALLVGGTLEDPALRWLAGSGAYAAAALLLERGLPTDLRRLAAARPRRAAGSPG